MSSDREGPPIRTLWRDDDGAIAYVDQRFLPREIVIARAPSAADAIAAIASGAITGSRFIDAFAGCAAALARNSTASTQLEATLEALRENAAARTYRLDAFERVLRAPHEAAYAEAGAIIDENMETERAIAGHAATLLAGRSNVLTAAASGALATGCFGTAASAIVAAYRQGRHLHAFVAETSPLYTGERLTAVEFRAADVPHRVVVDAAIAALIGDTPIDAVILGAEAIAANGDTIGELGTLAIAIAAAYWRVPVFVACPRASIEIDAKRGDALAARMRGTPAYGRPATNAAAAARVPPNRYDVTPGNLITAIVTEFGVSRPPYDDSLATLTTRPNFFFTRGR